MKTKIYEGKHSKNVVVEYDDVFTGERRRRQFMAPAVGGYVREWTGGGWSQQVCDGLEELGDTLYLPEGASLIAMIRREYRAMRRNEKQMFR